MLRVICFLLPFLLLCNATFAQGDSRVSFTENKGQWESPIIYKATLDGGALYFENQAMTYAFYDKEKYRSLHGSHGRSEGEQSVGDIKRVAFRIAFDGSQKPMVSAEKPWQTGTNYFLGSNRNRWKSDVKSFESLKYIGLYQGIDLTFFGMDNSIKYNFYVAPKADYKQIKLKYQSAKVSLKSGNLIIQTALGEILEQSPIAYQFIDGERKAVDCNFILKENVLSFEVKKYNANYELIIDPVVVYGSYSGSLADNFGMTATYDNAGNLISGGTVFDNGFPYTTGAFDSTYNGVVRYGMTDVIITKYDTSLSNLVYSTYIGGAKSSEIVTSIISDEKNNLYLYGATGSDDFPVTIGAYDTTYNGGAYLRFYNNGTYFTYGTDIFVAKLNTTGSDLLGATYLGGSLNDGVNMSNDTILRNNNPLVYEPETDSLQYNYGDQYRGEITLDPQGYPYIVSSTRSPDFPAIRSFDSSLGGKQDAIVCKFSSNLKILQWSTFLGGSKNDAGYGINIDVQKNVVVTGGTTSANFPTTVGVVSNIYKGGKADGFISIIDDTGAQLLKSTYIGSSEYDQSYFVQTDPQLNVYVTGQTSGSFNVRPDTIYNNANSKQFILKLNHNLSDTIFATVFGNGNNSINLSPSAFLVDKCQKVYFSGWGGSILSTGTRTDNMPLKNAWQSSNPDGFNFYLIVFEKDMDSLLYATYFGGAQSKEHVDGGTSRFDSRGIVYQSVCAGCVACRGCGPNSDFPTTPNAWSNINRSNNCNNGVFKFDFNMQVVAANILLESSNVNGCAPLDAKFNNLSNSASSFLWDFGNGDLDSTTTNPTRLYNQAGTYPVKLLVRNPLSCNLIDSSIIYVTVNPPVSADFDFTVPSTCSNTVSFIDASNSTSNVSTWYWDFGDGEKASIKDPVHTYKSLGNYTATLKVENYAGCGDKVEVLVDLRRDAAGISKDTTICASDSVQLVASGGTQYKWTPTTGLSNPFIANPMARPRVTTIYTVEMIQKKADGSTCNLILSTSVNVKNSGSAGVKAYAEKDTIVKGASVQLHAVADKPSVVLWIPFFSLDDNKSLNPIAKPEEDTKYSVAILDEFACTYFDSIWIYVNPDLCSEDGIFIPTAFSPNGDGINDTLFIRGKYIKEFYFAVYNQWGEIMFETYDIRNGWDGLYKKEKSDPGVFAFYLKVICESEKTFIKKGNVTLLR